jgi:hypothetical protein
VILVLLTRKVQETITTTSFTTFNHSLLQFNSIRRLEHLLRRLRRRRRRRRRRIGLRRRHHPW